MYRSARERSCSQKVGPVSTSLCVFAFAGVCTMAEFFARAFSGDVAALALLTAIDRVGAAQPLQPGDEDALNASEQGWPQHARDAGLDYRGGKWTLADTSMYREFSRRKNAARAEWHERQQSGVYQRLDEKMSELREHSRGRGTAGAMHGGGNDGDGGGDSVGSNTSSEGILLASREHHQLLQRRHDAQSVIAAMRSFFSTFNLSASALLFGIQHACALQASKAPGLVYWYLDRADIGAKGSDFCEAALDLLTLCGFVPSAAPASAMEDGVVDSDTLIWTLLSGTWARRGLQQVAKASLSSMVVKCRPSGGTEVVKPEVGPGFTFAQAVVGSSCCAEWCSIL